MELERIPTMRRPADEQEAAAPKDVEQAVKDDWAFVGQQVLPDCGQDDVVELAEAGRQSFGAGRHVERGVDPVVLGSLASELDQPFV